ncbi:MULTISPECIES: hypothetical protein [Actinomadura]|uniref:Uncharacterized protein n=1 Tax=Actinomadura yumaensis TaxID=111807 RepID=A0ABW2CQR5_9ACTN|nr:hypothetical protein [Actinomadura sp. J1-007]MWK32867.1 hypothetical protein [Actinomadura sp. J1-007]
MTAQMRTGPAARDPNFRGIDPPALNQVIRQLQDANTAIKGWLNGHRPPPGVSSAGYRQADQVAQWAADQLGMLTRRYNYAVTHPDEGGGVDAPPPAPAPGSGASGNGGGSGPARRPAPTAPRPRKQTPRREPTPKGAGDLGNFPDRPAALKAARTDALAVVAAVQDRKAIPESVWKHLKANADDPDYTEKLYERLGPAASADLLKAARGDEARLKSVEESLGTASHHLTMDAKWLRAFLAEADRAGVRPVAVQVLNGAAMSDRTRDAIAGLHLGSAPKAAMAGEGNDAR